MYIVKAEAEQIRLLPEKKKRTHGEKDKLVTEDMDGYRTGDTPERK